MDIIQKIIDNRDKIVGIKIDGQYYDIDYILADDAEVYDMLAPNDILIRGYLIDCDDGVMIYEITVEDIRKAKDVKLYKLEEI